MKRPHLSTLLLLALIAGLGYLTVEGQRREARLQAALAMYQERAGKDLDWVLALRTITPWDRPQDACLRDVVRWIREVPSAVTMFPRGVPVLVDTEGLREAGQTLDSRLTALPPEPGSAAVEPDLREKLRIILDPLGLAAEVRGGAIVITSKARAQEKAGADDTE